MLSFYGSAPTLLMKSTTQKKLGKTALRAGLGIAAVVGLLQGNAHAQKPKWDTTAGVGLTIAKGNSDAVVAAANIQSKGNWKNYAITLGGDASYGEQNNAKNVESYRAFGQYDRKVSKKFYVFGRAEYYHDAVADIEYRVKLSPGFGWHVIEGDKVTLDVEVGPGYVFEKLGSVSDSFATLRVGDRFSYKISDRARLWQSAEFIPSVENFSDYRLSAQIGIEADLTEKMALRSVLQDEYTSSPAVGRKKNDIKLITSVNYKF